MKSFLIALFVLVGGLFGFVHTAFAAAPAMTSATESTVATAPTTAATVMEPKPVSFEAAITATLGFTQAWGVLDDLYVGILFPSLGKFFQGGIIDNDAINKVDVVKSFAIVQKDIAKLETETVDGKKLSALLTELQKLTPCERVIMREWGEGKKFPDLDGCPSGFVDGLVAFVGQHVTSTTEQLNGWTSKMAQRELIPAEYDSITFKVDLVKTKLPDLFKVLKVVQVFHAYAPREVVKKVLPSGISDEELEKIRKEAYDKGYSAGATSDSGGGGSTLKLGKWEAFVNIGYHADEDVGGPNHLRYEKGRSLNLGGRYELLDDWISGEAGLQFFSVIPTYEGPAWLTLPDAKRITVVTPFLGASFHHNVMETELIALTPRISADVGYGFGHGLMVQAAVQLDVGFNTPIGRLAVSPGFGIHRQSIQATLGPDAYGANVQTNEEPSVAPVGMLEISLHFGGVTSTDE